MPLSACRSLATASNCIVSSASLTQLLLSQPPMQNSCQMPTLNWTNSLTNQLLHFTPLHFIKLNCTQPSQSHIATDGQSVSKSLCRGPSGAHDQIFITVWQLRSCFLWGALSDERTGLSSVYAAGHFQRSLCQVRAPWDSRLYFTLSDLTLPFSSPPTSLR
jgi:hypothetical protein